MSVEELKRQAAALPPEKQRELAAFLVHLRNTRDAGYESVMRQRMDEKDRSRWLTPDEFERRLDAR
jgi:hypothetical protein